METTQQVGKLQVAGFHVLPSSCVSCFCRPPHQKQFIHPSKPLSLIFFLIFAVTYTQKKSTAMMYRNRNREGRKSLMIWCMTFSSFFIERNYKLKNNKTINLPDCAFCFNISLFITFLCSWEFFEVNTIALFLVTCDLGWTIFYWFDSFTFFIRWIFIKSDEK